MITDSLILKKILPHHSILLLLLAIIYLFLPNNNHLADSYAYGASVKYGADLFYPHHLLFNGFNYLIFNIFKAAIPSLDALHFIQFVNAIFSVLCLLLLRRVLILIGNQPKLADWFTFFVGCSFGVMRFSVEAEVYILPIFFSLLSSLFYLKYLKNANNTYALLSGSMATIACLFHQIHLFWGIGLLIGLLFNKKIKPILLYLLSTPLVIVAYAMVLFYYYHLDISISNISHYLANYYYSNDADTAFGLKDILITFITFFRTFFQVHGVVIEVFRLYTVPTFIAILITLGLIYRFFYILIKSDKHLNFNFKGDNFGFTHLIIFGLQLAFALFSHGNSEFMVMLPFLIIIILCNRLQLDMRLIKISSATMLIWNLTFAIIPNHFLNYKNEQTVVKMLHDHPDKFLLVRERTTPANLYFYMYGIQENNHIIQINHFQKNKKLNQQNSVYWTCLLSRKEFYDRVSFTHQNSETKDLKFVRHIAKIQSDMGAYFIDEVKF